MLAIKTIRIKKFGRKSREFFYATNRFTKWLDNKCSIITNLFSGRMISRINQSEVDMKNLSKWKYVMFVDIKNCFLSFDVYAYTAKKWWLKRLLLNLLFNSKVDGKYPEYVSLRGGLSISNAIMKDVTNELLKRALTFNVTCQVFVDDLAAYSDSVDDLERFLSFTKWYLAQFKLELHPKENKNKNSGVMDLAIDQRLSGRLGLLFYRKNGEVFSKIRPSTKRLFLLKLNKRLYNAKTSEKRLRIVKRMLYGEFGLYKTWPASIWTCLLDRKLFEIRIGRLVKKYLRTELNAKELIFSARLNNIYCSKFLTSESCTQRDVNADFPEGALNCSLF